MKKEPMTIAHVYSCTMYDDVAYMDSWPGLPFSYKTRFCKTIVNVHLFLVWIGFISFFTLYDRPVSLKPIHLGNIRIK